jgi:TonB family protein
MPQYTTGVRVGLPSTQHGQKHSASPSRPLFPPSSRTGALALVLLALACSPGTTLLHTPVSATVDAAPERAPGPSTSENGHTSRAQSSGNGTHGRLAHSARGLSWLSPRHVGAAVRAQQEAFSACQTLADLEARPRDGAVTLSWSVSADGSVEAVALGDSSFDSESVDDCVLAVAKKVSFPASPARTQVSWTVKFTSLGREPLAEAGSGSRQPR